MRVRFVRPYRPQPAEAQDGNTGHPDGKVRKENHVMDQPNKQKVVLLTLGGLTLGAGACFLALAGSSGPEPLTPGPVASAREPIEQRPAPAVKQREQPGEDRPQATRGKRNPRTPREQPKRPTRPKRPGGKGSKKDAPPPVG